MFKKLFKSDSSKFTAWVIIFTILTLISLPRIPIKIDSQFLQIDSFIGGYIINSPIDNQVYDISDFKRGLDLEGGVRLVLKLDTSSLNETEKEDALSSVRDIIERRVNFLGVSETSVSTSRSGEDYKVVVELPGEKNIEEATRIIGSTAQLAFKGLNKDISWPLSGTQSSLSFDEIFDEATVTGKDLVSADVSFNQNTNEPVIVLNFTTEGRVKFEDLLKKNIKKPIGIFLDDTLLSYPVVSEDIANSPVISPTIQGLSLQEARDISSLLKAGALPVPIKITEQSLIGPSLGVDSIRSSLIAGGVGLFVISVLLVVIYGRLGFIANLCLLVYFVTMLAIFKLSTATPFPIVLTLPGLAGFIFSIGVACDANILIFERIKDELRSGVPFSIAIERGFSRAWGTIRDSNLTAVIVAIILFQLGSGFIKGFSVVLIIGTLVSIFTSVYLSRLMISLFIKELRFK
jgi:preprotein translocase subunit SecD